MYTDLVFLFSFGSKKFLLLFSSSTTTNQSFLIFKVLYFDNLNRVTHFHHQLFAVYMYVLLIYTHKCIWSLYVFQQLHILSVWSFFVMKIHIRSLYRFECFWYFTNIYSFFSSAYTWLIYLDVLWQKKKHSILLNFSLNSK